MAMSRSPLSHAQYSPMVAPVGYMAPWKRCRFCSQSAIKAGGKSRVSVTSDSVTFLSIREFCRHLRELHCTREGGSFVCLYGPNGVCPSLPIEGVSDKDYEDHVTRDHAGEIGSMGVDGAPANYSKSRDSMCTSLLCFIQVRKKLRWNDQ